MATSKTLKFSGQKALTMALCFISETLEIKDMYLNMAYGLNRCTLCRIRKGEDVPRSHAHYMRVFISILNEHRRSYAEASDYERANRISGLLRDMLLVEYCIPTDGEIMEHETIVYNRTVVSIQLFSEVSDL